MTDDRRRLAPVSDAAVTVAAAITAVVVIVWALTGVGYFWPVWVMLALGFALGLPAAIARGSRSEALGDGLVTAVGGGAAVISAGLTVIWLITGFGYFWPVWGILGLAVATGSVWFVRRPARRSLEVRVDELTRTRSGALDVQASELRRIERDLHDGAQARLVALSMKLGRAEQRLAGQGVGEPEIELLREARQEAAAAIAELRDLARGISPPVLADRGLEAAVQSLANRAGAVVAVGAALTRRPPPAVETAAYFVVAESLTNAAKHAPGAGVQVTLSENVAELIVEVTDYGPGGADEHGSGLTGLRQRVEALDGRLEITSPPGVGTMIEAVLPCGW
ncbi:MAG: histidine kinase [Solirubrobacteraceae bacterium]|jgi:signal transduction histidine kinase